MTSVSMRVDVAGEDGIPHTFLVVTHPDGRVLEYGLAPQVTGLSGPGKIFITGLDSDLGRTHEFQFQGPTQQLSDTQYQRLMDDINQAIANPPYYIVSGTWTPGEGTNCTGWAVNIWQGVGLPNTFGVTNSWVWNPYGQAMNIAIANVVNTTYTTAQTFRPRRDPLAIDLDGDGIETVGIGANPIQFDHNADGIKTGTGWVAGDDAWLVLDRDGNGLIDSGRELFGVDTLLAGTAGSFNAVYASSGFEALKTLDSNHDNVFDALDTAFTQVRLWQDVNQDGVSQAGELFTLTQKNITSIGLVASTATTNLGNGNTVSGTAVVTRTNGTTTTATTVSVGEDNTANPTSASNLNLANNPFYRTFTNSCGAKQMGRVRRGQFKGLYLSNRYFRTIELQAKVCSE